MIILYRIDDRLVHGQVVEGWVPHLRAEELAVVSDEIAGDEMRRTIMRFATPEGVDLRIMTVDEAAAYLPEAERSGKKVLLLLPGLVRLQQHFHEGDALVRGEPVHAALPLFVVRHEGVKGIAFAREGGHGFGRRWRRRGCGCGGGD